MSLKAHIAFITFALFILISENQPQLLDGIADLLQKVVSALYKVALS